jgi:hypothetical protein
VRQLLETASIPFFPAQGGLTVCLDLRAVAQGLGEGWEGEEELYHQLVRSGKVLLAPGRKFGFREPGVFRMTIAEPLEGITVAIERIRQTLEGLGQLQRVQKASICQQFVQLWERTDQIFALVQDLCAKPIGLRHPVLFYVGHLPAFLLNQLQKVDPSLKSAADSSLAELFDRGIDPDVDDPSKVHPNSAGLNVTEWPAMERIDEFRKVVRKEFPGFVEAILESKGRAEVFDMVLEHEVMHQETLLYMINCLPLNCVNHPTQETESAGEEATSPSASFVHIPGNKKVVLGKSDNQKFAWDNE